MNMNKIHVKKGDTVTIISGDDKGKKGKVLRVDDKKGRVVVEGLNMMKKHLRPNRDNPQGGIVQIPAPMKSSKVMIVCPSCGKPTRIAREKRNDGKVRVCKQCNKVID
jgi:large subunit ribosomal protein L24